MIAFMIIQAFELLNVILRRVEGFHIIIQTLEGLNAILRACCVRDAFARNIFYSKNDRMKSEGFSPIPKQRIFDTVILPNQCS